MFEPAGGTTAIVYSVKIAFLCYIRTRLSLFHDYLFSTKGIVLLAIHVALVISCLSALLRGNPLQRRDRKSVV